MSASSDPGSNTKPVVKDKNPHNYRKVGYSMIVISVSLVVIALIVWGIGDDYHFSTNIMALQEVDAMTPKAGYHIVMFDVSQPVGAKLKLLDQADTLDAAQALQDQDAKQNTGNTIQVLLFNSSKDYNLRLMSDAEVFLKTPPQGYNVVLFDGSLAIGQQLTMGIHEDLLENATAYQQQQEDNLKGTPTQVLIFTSNYNDDLKLITGSSVPVEYYAVLAKNLTSMAQTMPPATNQTAQITSANSTNATTTNVTPPIALNQTANTQTNQSSTNTNQTTSVNATSTNQTNALTNVNLNTTTTNALSGTTVVISDGASATKGTCSETDCYNPKTINVNVGDAVTWKNDDTVGHTATSGMSTDNQTGTVFDSGLILVGKSYTSPAFNTAGTYDYYCMVHPWMTGQVIVGSAVSTSPTSTNETGISKSVNLNETISITAAGK